MNREHEPLSYHAKELALFSAHSSYWKRLARINAKSEHLRRRDRGFQGIVSKAAEGRRGGLPLEMEYYDAGFAPTLGMPLAFRSGDRNKVYCLTGENAAGLTEGDIRELLSRPVFADGKSVRMLMDRGFDVFGVEAYETSVLTLSEDFCPARSTGISAHRAGINSISTRPALLSCRNPTK